MSRVRGHSAITRIKQAAAAKVAADPGLVKLLLAGGAGALAGSSLGAHLTHARDEEAQRRAKNVAFGAGIATGLASPRIISGLNTKLNPQPPVAAADPSEVVQ